MLVMGNRIGRGGRNTRALCIDVGKSSMLTFILFMFGQLDPSPNSIDLLFDVRKSPGQSTEQYQVVLLK